MAVRFDNDEYIEMTYLKECHPDLFTQCRNNDQFIQKYNIPTEFFKYTTQGKDRKILPYDTTCRKRYTFIKKNFIDTNLMKKNYNERLLPELPPKIDLEEHEFFRDQNGEIVDVTIRGKRKPNEIFFKASDIGKMLGLSNIRVNISADCFCKNEDYIHFRSHSDVNKPVTYLTYNGLLRIIFTRRHPIAQHYVRWSVEILFAAHFGSQEQRIQVAADHIIKIDPRIIKQFLDTNVDSLPVVYFLYLGTVKDLKHKIDIPEHFDDTQQVFKYGVSKDFRERIEQHENTYMKKYRMNLELKHHMVIDEKYIFEAESFLRNYFEGNGWSVKQGKDFNELAVISESTLKSTIPFVFRDVQHKYTGKLKDFLEMKRKTDERCSRLEEELEREKQDGEKNAQYYTNLLHEKDERMREKDDRLREKNQEFQARCALQDELIQLLKKQKS